jgi:hypothetical protein
MADLLPILQNGFYVAKPREKDILKLNTLRYTKSTVGVTSPPALKPQQVLYTQAEAMNNEPASCYNCIFFKEPHCQLHDSRIIIRKFIQAGEGGKDVEYWPCCSYHSWGETGAVKEHLESWDGDVTGLIWINAPRPGLEYSGASCGGCDTGDDCDFFYPRGSESKREAVSGFCRVLQSDVGAGDVCSAWQDDDQIDFRTAQDWLTKTSKLPSTRSAK